jgi:outer membrane receptor protein involved in Fe transport
VPGLLAVQHQGGGKADQLFLRGFDADHGTDVAVFVDGVPINLPSHAHGQGFTDLHWLIPEAVERIDVVKGPYDVRYGDFATAGAVNLYTRGQFEQSSVSLTLGGYPTRGCDDFPKHCKVVAQQRMVAIAAPKLGGWAAKLHPWIAFEAARDDGPFISGQGLSRYNLFAKLTYDLGPHTVMGAFVSAYGSGWRSSGQIPSREVDAGLLDPFGAVDPTEGGETQRQMVTAFLRHKDPKHELTATLYYVRYRMSLWNNFTFFRDNPIQGDQIEQDDDRHVTGFNLAYHVHHKWRSLSFRTTLGAQVRWDGAKLDIWDASARKRIGRHVDGGAFPFGNDSRVDVLTLSAFAEEDVAFNKYVRAIIGLRGDYFGFNVDDPTTAGVKQKTVASPKATVVITPVRPLDLYFNFGMGFHSNDARLSVLEGSTTAAGSVVNVVPRIYGGEVGARLSLWNRVSVAAAFWASYLENESVFVGDAGAFEPSDPSRRLGLDVELRVQALPWLQFDFDLSYANTTVALAPRLYMTGGVSVKHPKGVRAGLRFRYLGDRPGLAEDSEEYQRLNAIDPRRVNAEGWFVLDLYGAYRYRWFEVQAAVQNLTNTSWREAQFVNASCTRREVACTGITDVHFTPGVPLNLQLTVKAYF